MFETEAHFRDVLFLADILDAFLAPIRLPQDADLVFRGIPFVYHCLVLSHDPDQHIKWPEKVKSRHDLSAKPARLRPSLAV